MKILLVDDDKASASVLADALTTYHYTVNTAEDGQTGLELAQTFHYDLILLDIMLPKLDGISLCRQLRSQGLQIPILLLSGKDSSTDRITGLEAGADDYLVKPYDLSELMARIRALLRRGSSTLSTILTWEKLRFDPDSCEVSYGEKPLHLTPKEYSLLELFLRHPRRIFSRSAILDHIWSINEFPGEEAVTTQIKGLRQKLKAGGMSIGLIETVYGLGYRLKAPPEEEQQKQENGGTQEHSGEASPAQVKVMATIAQIWNKFKDSLPEKLALFENVSVALASDALDQELQQKARGEAHRLIGSLGSFGFPEGSTVAREIEQLLQSQRFSAQEGARRLKQLVGWLEEILERQPFSTTAAPVSGVSSARLLIIDDDKVLTERIEVEAKAWGLRVNVASDLKAARQAIARQCPDVILLDLTFPDTTENGLVLLAELCDRKPEIPVLVVTGQNQLSSRLEAVRLGAHTFLHKPIPPGDILKAATEALNQTQLTEANVMVVDDDSQVLATLHHLLQPWGLEVTTLDNPQRFWEVLEGVVPDLLILDIEMPAYNGLELCQVVRNDSHWQNLPILFLSAHADTQIVQEVFARGADDYVKKPIVESELIARVLNRLERTKLRHKMVSSHPSNLPIDTAGEKD
ncbi:MULTISPECIES: response regulator [unclassified Coleofasciculus]|uniref:response regulator n=1 Tax=unclassified Coleofasciculus TaxID=2692782 RepID=UPI00187EE3B6|nr:MULTISPECIES: response regulator [unclassified Coleofasciculus]MBE9126451.1 response regulator [Coleofasciculus sp. LEGE 07081]MBE9148053.1 response regulator [Coleofasciculus sp. LEGE 07092]